MMPSKICKMEPANKTFSPCLFSAMPFMGDNLCFKRLGKKMRAHKRVCRYTRDRGETQAEGRAEMAYPSPPADS
jgi:hypothetical protein